MKGVKLSTQTDRIIAVILAAAYVGGLVFVVSIGRESMTAYYIALGTVIVIPVVSYLVARVSDVREIKSKLDDIEKNTNGRLTTRLNKQTEDIVSQISSTPNTDDFQER